MATWLHKQQMGCGTTLRPDPLWAGKSPGPGGSGYPRVTPWGPAGTSLPWHETFVGGFYREQAMQWLPGDVISISTFQDTSAKLSRCPCDFPSQYTPKGSAWKSFPISYCLFILLNFNQSKARDQETFWHNFSLSPVPDFPLNQPKGQWADGGSRWAAVHEAPSREQRPQSVCWNRGCPLYKVITVWNEHLGNGTASRSKRSHRTKWGECTISEKAMWWLEAISDLYITASK